MNKSKKFNVNLISCTFVALLAIVFLISSFSIKDPSSRLVPQTLCGLTLVLCVIFLISIYFGKYKNEEIDLSGTMRACQMGLILVGYIMLNYFLGFYIAAVIFLPAGMLFLGQRSWKVITGVSVSLPLIVYLFFDLLLNMQMPQALLFS